MSYLAIHDLQVDLGGAQILKGIDMKVIKGEFISLLGPSGCGKTTLLKTLAGFIVPVAGDIYFGKNSMQGVAPEKRGAVIVFQDLRLFPHMNVLDNIAFGLKMQGLEKTQRQTKAEDLLAKVGLEGMGKRKIASLSGGQQQRVALARALAVEPRLLLLDEAFSSLDSHLRQKMRDLVLKLHRELGLTTILVTHDYKEALMMSDRVAVMFDGKIAQFDTPRAIYESPVQPQVADYFGEMNYLKGVITGQEFVSEIDGFTTPIDEHLGDGQYLMMLKPDSIRIAEAGDTNSDSTGRVWKVLATSYQGGRSLIRLGCNGEELLVEHSGRQELRLDTLLSVEPDFSKASFFRIGLDHAR